MRKNWPIFTHANYALRLNGPLGTATSDGVSLMLRRIEPFLFFAHEGFLGWKVQFLKMFYLANLGKGRKNSPNVPIMFWNNWSVYWVSLYVFLTFHRYSTEMCSICKDNLGTLKITLRTVPWRLPSTYALKITSVPIPLRLPRGIHLRDYLGNYALKVT